MLSVKIEKRVGTFLLKAELEVQAERLALLGASGSGKTLTLQCIAGLIRPDAGTIVLDGRTLFDSKKGIDLTPQQRQIGLLFQNYALFPNMTVRENIVCGLHRLPRKGRRQEAQKWMEKLCLQGLEEQYPRQLSGGQQQRTALARCLASNPKLILLDEPFSALDEHLRWKLEKELLDTLEEFEGSTLYVTHSREEVKRICGRVCMMKDGSSQPIVSTKEWLEHPKTRYAARLAGYENDLDAQLFPSLEHSVVFRAEDAMLSTNSCPSAIECQVERVLEDEIWCAVKQAPTCLLRCKNSIDRRKGDTVWVSVKENRWIRLQQEER